MPIVTFKPARRIGSRVIIICYAESGAGKTRSMLRLARGLVGPEGRIVMIDTENGRGLLHSEHIPGGFTHGELTQPHTPERYVEALNDAEEFGADVIVVDSGSNEWEGFGGYLDIAEDQRDSQGRPLRGQLKHAVPKARHKKYYQRLLACKCHVIVCLRAKEKLVTLDDTTPIPEGKKKGDIVSHGLIPIQDKRFIFETTVQIHFPTGGERGVPLLKWPWFKCSDDLEGAFPPGKRIDEETGRMIAEWVAGGTPIDRQFEELKRRAEDAAAAGTESYRKWWQTAGRPTQERLAETHENNKSIAAEADKRLASTTAGIAADVIDATPSETLALRLAAASTIPEVDAIEDEWREPMGEMPHDDWLAAQAAIDGRRVELENAQVTK